MTPSGTEPATFRFVAQHLNHLNYRGLQSSYTLVNLQTHGNKSACYLQFATIVCLHLLIR